MALMEWATNVPQKLLQCDAKHLMFTFLRGGKRKNNVELISKKSCLTNYCLKFGSMKKEFRVIVDK